MKLFSREIGRSNEEPETKNEWSEAMEDVEDFSKHMKQVETSQEEEPAIVKKSPMSKEEFRATRVQRALRKIGVEESRADDAKFEEDLNNLGVKDAYRMLLFVNGIVTGANKHDRRVWRPGVWSGAEISGHLSPALDVQDTAIEETFDAIKNDVKDNHKRAALICYMIGHLHLFNDGNGRTARTMYEVFDKRDFSVIGSDFMHQTEDEDEVGSNRKGFFEERNLPDPKVVSDLTMDFVKRDLVEERKLPEEMLQGYFSLNLPSSHRPMPDVYLTRDAEQNLDAFEKQNVRHAFFEKPIATTALGMMLKKKYTFRWAVQDGARKNDSGDVFFEIENKDKSKAKEVFDGWGADDYRDFCDTVKELQLRQARKLIDIFKNEEKYKTVDGKPFADVISGL